MDLIRGEGGEGKVLYFSNRMSLFYFQNLSVIYSRIVVSLLNLMLLRARINSSVRNMKIFIALVSCIRAYPSSGVTCMELDH